jgi:hypothetical protein
VTVSSFRLTWWQKATIVGVIGGIAFFVYYKLGQQPPYYITPLNPLGVLLFFLLTGAIGAIFATGEWKKVETAATAGAVAGFVTGTISAVTLVILNNIYLIGLSGMLHDWLYYLIFGGYFTVVIAVITMIIGALGGIIFSLAVRLIDVVRRNLCT